MPSLGPGVAVVGLATFLVVGLLLVAVVDRLVHRGDRRRPVAARPTAPQRGGPVAAGWYDDPFGSHGRRWFDGSGWTDRIE